MKKLFFGVCLWLVLPLLGHDAHFAAFLSGTETVPAVDTAASGRAEFVLDEAGRLTFQVGTAGLSGEITAIHIHEGIPGEVGSVLVDLSGGIAGTTVSGTTAPLSDSDILAMISGHTYLNVHTAQNSGGEIRGQIVLTRTFLNGIQQSSANSSPGTGTATVFLSQDGELFYDIRFENLVGNVTDAHLHEGGIGDNGSIMVDIHDDLSGNSLTGSATLSDSEINLLLNGQVYVNIHTDSFPGGEIRGQLIPTNTFLSSSQTQQEGGGGGDYKVTGPSGMGFFMLASGDIQLNGAQAGITTEGVGTARFFLRDDELVYAISTDELDTPITAAHIHSGAPGVSGGVLVDLGNGLSGSRLDGTVTLSQQVLDAILSGDTYVNVHTAAVGSGEIRAQVVLDTLAYTVTTTGLSGDITAAHIHDGALGTDGGILVDLGDGINGQTLSGTVSGISAELASKMLREQVYVNLHTEANPTGEIRGQVVLSGGDRVAMGSHVTPGGALFATTVGFVNNHMFDAPYMVRAYSADGAIMGLFTGTVPAGGHVSMDATDLFGSGNVGFFDVLHDVTDATIGYVLKQGDGSPVSVPAGSQTGTVFRFTPGNWELIFDGLALVNLGDRAAQVKVYLLDAGGDILDNENVTSDDRLDPMEKMLVVAGSPNGDGLFSNGSGTTIQVESDQPLSLLTLGGTPPGASPAYLWATQAIVVR